MEEKILYINGKKCSFTDEPNLLEVIRKNGFSVFKNPVHAPPSAVSQRAGAVC